MEIQRYNRLRIVLAEKERTGTWISEQMGHSIRGHTMPVPLLPEWIQSYHIYNIRLGKTKGSMEANRDLFESTSLLILYELGKPNNLSVYKIVDHQEMGKDELMKLDYPNKKPRKSYMAFNIEPLEGDLTFLIEHHLIERLIELNAKNAKGTPVFIEP